jgi:hypothetical protein
MFSKVSIMGVVKVKTVGAGSYNTCKQGYLGVHDVVRCLDLKSTSTKV